MHTTVVFWLLSSFSIRHLLMPWGNSVSWLTRLFLMAKLTLCILGSHAGFPFQNKVYPPFSSLSCPSSASLVSDRAPKSMLKSHNSLDTKAVCLSHTQSHRVTCLPTGGLNHTNTHTDEPLLDLGLSHTADSVNLLVP